jgi:poly(A) polymerase
VQVTLQHRRFRAAYDLYLLREALGETDPEAIRFWTDLQTGDPPPVPREAESPVEGEAPPRRRRRSRGGRSRRAAREPAPPP